MKSVSVAPIGLIRMFNSGGAVRSIRSIPPHELRETRVGDALEGVEIQVKGGGLFVVYASRAPASCFVDGIDVEFGYCEGDGRVTVELSFECRDRSVSLLWGEPFNDHNERSKNEENLP